MGEVKEVCSILLNKYLLRKVRYICVCKELPPRGDSEQQHFKTIE